MHIRFWGTRGSLPKPGPTTLRYGGNTSCVEVRTAGGTLIVLDCGSGAHDLGQALLAEASGPLQAHCHRSLGTLYATRGQQEQARAELSTAMEMYRTMEMTFWLPQGEAVLAQVGEGLDTR